MDRYTCEGVSESAHCNKPGTDSWRRRAPFIYSMINAVGISSPIINIALHASVSFIATRASTICPPLCFRLCRLPVLLHGVIDHASSCVRRGRIVSYQDSFTLRSSLYYRCLLRYFPLQRQIEIIWKSFEKFEDTIEVLSSIKRSANPLGAAARSGR